VQTIVVLEGDQTGQELLEEALRTLAPDVVGVELGLVRFDLSLEGRRATQNGVVHEAAAAVREHGYGLKAATVTPEGAGDVGSPNRILREEIGGKVIVRTGGGRWGKSSLDENGQSRIYLGIHWSFDKREGIAQGRRVANHVFDRAFLPKR